MSGRAGPAVIEANGGRLDGRVKSLRTGGDVRRYWIDGPAALAQRKLLIASESLGCVNAGFVLYIHGG
jgi:hypothetical protein